MSDTPKLPPHPMQPLVLDGDVPRFRKNAIVCFLLDAGPFDMNMLARMPGFSDEDREQFAQLIGYSVGGFGELSYVSGNAYKRAQSAVRALPGGDEPAP